MPYRAIDNVRSSVLRARVNAGQEQQLEGLAAGGQIEDHALRLDQARELYAGLAGLPLLQLRGQIAA